MILSGVENLIGNCIAAFDPAYGLTGGLFLMGLIGGVSHCTGMCGPFVLSQSGHMTRIRDAALISYHLGRIVTYTILALIMYSLVNVLAFYSPLRVFVTVPLLFFAGFLFIVNAFPSLLRIFPWIRYISLPVSQNLLDKLSSHTSHRFLLGMILGLMPCGMVMAAIMASATAPSMVMAAVAMMAFGVGTMPALIGLAVTGNRLSARFPDGMRRVRRGLMVWSGLWLFAMAGLMVMRG